MRIIKVTAVALLAVLTGLVLIGAGRLYTGESRYELYIVESGSMEPGIPVGSLVVVDTEQTPETGDVVAYTMGGNVTTHRLIVINEDGTTVTQGDAMTQPDPFVVTVDDINGVVVGVYPGLGKAIAVLSTPAGFAAAAISIVGLALLGSALFGRRREDDDGDEVESSVDEPLELVGQDAR